MAFDIQGARQAGYSDTEIADYLGAQRKFDAGAARQAGYSDEELVAHLSTPAPPAPKGGTLFEPSSRAIVAGAMKPATFFGDALNSVINIGTGAVNKFTGTDIPRIPSASKGADILLDKLGFARPDSTSSRLLSDALEAAGGAMSIGGIASAVNPVSRIGQAIQQGMTTRPDVQTTAAAMSGLAAGATREAGGGPIMQTLAALLAPSPGGALTRVKAGTVRRMPDQLSPEAQARKADIEKLDPTLRPTYASISQDPRAWQFERNTAKQEGVGDPLVGRFKEHNEKLIGLVDEMRNSVGAKAESKYQAGFSIEDHILAKRSEGLEKISKLYKEIREKHGDKLGAVPENLLRQMDSTAEMEHASSIVKSVQNFLRKRKIINDEGQLAETAKSQPALSVTQAEELRKFIGRMPDGREPTLKKAKADLIEAVDDDVFAATGTDYFKNARATARKGYEEFEPKALKDVLDEKISADKYVDRYVLGGDVFQLESLKKTLTTGTPEQIERGRQAWANARGQVLDHLQQKAMAGDLEGGKFSGAAFSKELGHVGRDRLSVLFGSKELEQLELLGRVSKLLTKDVPFSGVNYSGTAAALSNLLNRMSSVPLLGSAVSPVVGLAKIGADARQAQQVREAVERALKGLPIPEGVLAKMPKQARETYARIVTQGSVLGAAPQSGKEE